MLAVQNSDSWSQSISKPLYPTWSKAPDVALSASLRNLLSNLYRCTGSWQAWLPWYGGNDRPEMVYQVATTAQQSTQLVLVRPNESC